MSEVRLTGGIDLLTTHPRDADQQAAELRKLLMDFMLTHGHIDHSYVDVKIEVRPGR